MDSLTKERLTFKDWVLGIFSYIISYIILMTVMIELGLSQSPVYQITSILISFIVARKLVDLNRSRKISSKIYLFGLVIFIVLSIYLSVRISVD